MELLKFNEVYDSNKKLDEKFKLVYGDNDEIVLKNKLELLVELGELANESKCFKYWSKKQPNKDLVLEEYADVLLMIFYFFNKLNVSLNEVFPTVDREDVNTKFITLFKLIAIFKDEYKKELIKEIFMHTLELGISLGFNDDEIISGCLDKIDIDMKRFDIEY